MSYSISVQGHKQFDDPEQAREWEAAQLARAREWLGQLEGVTAASGSTSEVGYVDLLAKP